MAKPLPEDVKKRAVERCAEYGFLEVQDPGTVRTTPDGRELVYVLDKGKRGLWLDISPRATASTIKTPTKRGPVNIQIKLVQPDEWVALCTDLDPRVSNSPLATGKTLDECAQNLWHWAKDRTERGLKPSDPL